MWCLGSSLALGISAVLFGRRSNRRTSPGVASQAVAVDPTASAGDSSHELPVPSREPAKAGTPLPVQKSFRSTRTTDWIIAASMMAVALAAGDFAVKSDRYNRSQYQFMASSAQTAVSVAEESIQTDQRAWVGLPLPAAYPLSKEGGGFVIKLQNFGKTPARNVLISDYVIIEELDQLSGMQEAASHGPMAAGTLMPGNGFSTEVRFKTSPEGVVSLAQGKVRAVNYALITYEDIFHRRHTTQSCFYWYGGLPMPLPCEKFNSVE